MFRVVGIVLLLAPFSSAAQPITEGRFLHTEFRFRPVPIGLGLAAKTGYRLPFYEHDNLALQRNGIETGVLFQASPISLHPGVYVRVTPLTIMEFEGGIQALTYFGVLNSVLGYGTGTADWSESGQRERKDIVGVKPGYGWSAYGVGRLKLMVKSIVAVTEFELRRLELQSPDTDKWYDPERHQLMSQSDQYSRSLSLMGWLFGKDMANSDIVAGVYWREWTAQGENARTLTGLGWIRQNSQASLKTRWLWILATYAADQYQRGDLFGALVWQRSWSL